MHLCQPVNTVNTSAEVTTRSEPRAPDALLRPWPLPTGRVPGWSADFTRATIVQAFLSTRQVPESFDMTSKAWMFCALGGAFALYACDSRPRGSQGTPSRINEVRVDLEATGAAGGAGNALGGAGGEGASVAPPFLEVCSADVYLDEETGLPECFVAEVSTEPLDCDLPGHEPLREEWENAARQRECSYRDLNPSACAELHLCGIQKLEAAAQTACQTGFGELAPGYCQVNVSGSECRAVETDSLRIVGTNPSAQALHISCALVDLTD